MSGAKAVQVVTLSNGATITVFEDGTKLQQSPDGTTIRTFADGGRETKLPDGISVVVRADGSKTQTNPDGTVIESSADGKHTKQVSPDGTELEMFEDGLRVQRSPNGVQIKIYTDGSRLQTFPDGTSIRVEANGDRFQKNPDGTTLWCKNDGTVEPVDRSRFREDPDPSTTTETTKKAQDSNSAGESRATQFALRQAKMMGLDPSSELSELELRIKTLQKENRQLHDTLQQLKRTNAAEAEATARKTHAERAKLIDELAESHEKARTAGDLEEALLRVQREQAAERNRFKRETDEVTSALLEAEGRADAAEKAAAEAVDTARKEAAAEIEALRAQVRDLEEAKQAMAKEANRGADAEETELRDKLARAESALSAANVAKQEAEAKRAVEAAASATWEAKAKALQEAKDAAVEEAQASRTELEAVHAQVEDLIFKGGSAAEQLIVLRKERDEAIAERDQSHDKLSDVMDKMVDTASSLAERETALAAAYNKLSETREQLALAKNPASLPDALAEERQRVRSLEAQLQEALELRTEYAQQVSVDTLHRRLAHAEEAAATVRSELRAANEDRDRLHALLATAKSAAGAGGDPQEAKLADEVTSLRVQLASSQRELEASRKQCAELEALQTVSLAAAVPNAALQVAEDSSTPPRRPPGGMGSLLAGIQGGVNLKKTPATPKAAPAAAAPRSPGSSSIAELCKLKAQQNADKARKIDELIHDNKRTPTDGAAQQTELQRALARRAART